MGRRELPPRQVCSRKPRARACAGKKMADGAGIEPARPKGSRRISIALPYRSANHPYLREFVVTTCGRIAFKTRKINLSQVFAGQMVAIKQVDERIWLVSFMDYDLGYIDLEQKTLQPIDNPFGARV